MLCLLLQRIEAPVRGGEEQAGSIPDGGPPIRERESELDREIVASAGNREREILGSGKYGQVISRPYGAVLCEVAASACGACIGYMSPSCPLLLQFSTCPVESLHAEVSIADSFRFKGAAPEIINSRCAS